MTAKKEKVYDLIIVGNGISAWCLLWYFSQRKGAQNLRVAHISADDYFRPCSLETTSHVARSGIEFGVSPLGDLLAASFQEFENFFKQEPQGVYLGEKLNICVGKGPQRAQFQKRYGPTSTYRNIEHVAVEKCYFIDPPELKNFLCQTAQFGEYHFFNYLYHSFSELEATVEIATHGPKLRGRRLILACGRNVPPSFSQELCSRPVAGTYGVCSGVNLGQKSFSYSIGSANLIYQHFSHCLLIGGSTDQGDIELPEISSLWQQWEIFNNLEKWGFALPKLSDFQLRVGIREKGRKRIPYHLGRKRVALIGGHYKNGFSTSFYFAKKEAERFL